MTRRFIRVGIAALLVLGPAAPAAGEDPAALLLGMAAAYARVERYTALFVRQEVVGGVARPREEALLKWERPGLMYLRWTAGPPVGREILFVPGRNDDRMLVREPGLLRRFATIVMAPDSPRVLEESRHPVTDIGIGRLIDLVLADTYATTGWPEAPGGSSGGSRPSSRGVVSGATPATGWS
jgi:hypothetical protein